MNEPTINNEPEEADEDYPKGPPRSARRRAREFALQGIYQWLLSREDAGAVHAHIAELPEFNRADKHHFDALLHGVIRDAESLRAVFQPFLDRPAAELSPVEHAVLLAGSFELTHQLDVPYRVVINESVEIAKAFGGADGFKYVNGVLDKVAGKVRTNEIQSRR